MMQGHSSASIQVTDWRRWTGAAVLLIVAMVSTAGAQDKITVIRGGTLIDGNGGAPQQNVSIVIAGNRIRSPLGGLVGVDLVNVLEVNLALRERHESKAETGK